MSFYKKLIVWQKSIVLVEEIYHLAKRFPDEERFGLTSQMRRSAISIPSNRAEGSCRTSRKDYRNFLSISLASGAELETQLIIAKRLEKTRSNSFEKADVLLEEIMKILSTIIRKLNSKT